MYILLILSIANFSLGFPSLFDIRYSLFVILFKFSQNPFCPVNDSKKVQPRNAAGLYFFRHGTVLFLSLPLDPNWPQEAL